MSTSFDHGQFFSEKLALMKCNLTSILLTSGYSFDGEFVNMRLFGGKEGAQIEI